MPQLCGIKGDTPRAWVSDRVPSGSSVMATTQLACGTMFCLVMVMELVVVDRGLEGEKESLELRLSRLAIHQDASRLDAKMCKTADLLLRVGGRLCRRVRRRAVWQYGCFPLRGEVQVGRTSGGGKRKNLKCYGWALQGKMVLGDVFVLVCCCLPCPFFKLVEKFRTAKRWQRR